MQWARAVLPFSGRATAVLIGAYALASLTAAGPFPGGRFLRRPGGGDRHSAGALSQELVVRVDGWYIEVDGVRGDGRHVRSPPVENAVQGDARTPYDALIAEAAEAAGLDSRLVSAIIFEESGFRADAVSPAGAYGLMQVRPVAAEEVGEVRYRDRRRTCGRGLAISNISKICSCRHAAGIVWP